MAIPPIMLSWIVPLYRNGGYAAELIRRTQAAAEAIGITAEIVMVDDACPEGSGRDAEQAVNRMGALRVEVIFLPVNHGQDAAIREGLRRCRGAHALIIDGDLQDPPEMLAELWPRSPEADVVFAGRWGAYETSGRLFTSQLYRKLMQWVGGLPPRAGVCALLNRKAIDAVASTRVRRLSLLAALAGAGLSYRSAAVQRQARTDRRTAYSSFARSRKAIHSLIQTIGARWLRIPL